jgi:peptide deformylase
MAILSISTIPASVLRAPTIEVDNFDRELHTFLDDMYETMVAAHGLGLAAPQVGISKKIAIIDLTVDGIGEPHIESGAGLPPLAHTHKGRLELVNPKVLSGGKKVSSDEGCLSIPEFRDSIQRHLDVKVEALDREGRKFSVSGEELLSFALQHEIDHLNGILFTDHLSRLKKQFFLKWCNKNIGTTDF